MRRTFYASTLALLLAALAAVSAQAQAASAPLPLPASDAVLTLDVRALFAEVLPRALASDKARLAQVGADVDEFKARTGIDAREFDTLAVGARVVSLPSGATKIDRVTAVARGRFKPEALVAAARAAAKGGLAEQTHGGKTVYVATVNDRVKLFGLARMHVRDLAFAVLDPNTLALGEPEDVRAAIDAQAGRGRADMSVLNFPKDAGTFMAFAGNIPAGALEGVDTGISANVDRAVASIRGFYGTVGSTAAGFQTMTTLRAGTAADAKQLFDVVNALRQIAPGFIAVAGEKWAFARGMVDSLKVTTKGNEVQLRLDIPQASIPTLLKSL
ncbi:MAG TPA: hypothetical protein VN282_15490 [Pyrinomonadaceae bacterium]|nr:hypothetical protein [Pyrinomonadaceae bacterium]